MQHPLIRPQRHRDEIRRHLRPPPQHPPREDLPRPVVLVWTTRGAHGRVTGLLDRALLQQEAEV